MNVLGQAQDAGSNIINQGMDFINDNFMASGSVTEKPEEVDQFRNYLNNLQGLNKEAINAGLSPFMTPPGPDLTNRDGVVGLDPNQIATVPVEEQGLEAFFGGQSKTDDFEDFDRRIPPKKTTQDYIDEFNEQFNLNEKLEIFGKGPFERQIILDDVSGYSDANLYNKYKMGIDPDDNKMFNQLTGENMDMSYSDFMTDNPGGGVFNLR
jgi:hypothetical protein